MTLRSELQELADLIASRTRAQASPVLPASVVHVERHYSSAYRSCCLCGDPLDSGFTCEPCNASLRRGKL